MKAVFRTLALSAAVTAMTAACTDDTGVPLFPGEDGSMSVKAGKVHCGSCTNLIG